MIQLQRLRVISETNRCQRNVLSRENHQKYGGEYVRVATDERRSIVGRCLGYYAVNFFLGIATAAGQDRDRLHHVERRYRDTRTYVEWGSRMHARR